MDTLEAEARRASKVVKVNECEVPTKVRGGRERSKRATEREETEGLSRAWCTRREKAKLHPRRGNGMGLGWVDGEPSMLWPMSCPMSWQFFVSPWGRPTAKRKLRGRGKQSSPAGRDRLRGCAQSASRPLRSPWAPHLGTGWVGGLEVASVGGVPTGSCQEHLCRDQ